MSVVEGGGDLMQRLCVCVCVCVCVCRDGRVECMWMCGVKEEVDHLRSNREPLC